MLPNNNNSTSKQSSSEIPHGSESNKVVSETKVVFKKTNRISTETSQQKKTATSSGATNFNEYMKSHITNKENTNKPITNTRIGNKETNIYGGSYHISPEEYPEFLNLYYHSILSQNKMEYLTEKQLETNCPALIDIDLRFSIDINERQYTIEHIEDLIDLYLDETTKMYQYDDTTRFQVYVFQKDTINKVVEKQITKDGIHIIFGLQIERPAQLYLRNIIIQKVNDIWGDFKIINNWDEVFDDGISAGHTNWQLYGSRKPNHDAYKLTNIYDISFDPTDGEIMRNSIQLVNFNIKDNIYKLSARYDKHPILFYKNSFLQVLNSLPDNNKKRDQPTISSPTTNSSYLPGGNNHTANLSCLSIRNKEQLDIAVNMFLESTENTQHGFELREAYDYSMTLPESYYGNGSFNKWIRVGWALKNIHNSLFIVWIAFSSQYLHFNYSYINELHDKWLKFDMNNPNGLTKRSLMHWSKIDANEEYKIVRKNNIEYHLNKSLTPITANLDNIDKISKGSSDFDIATVLHHIYKDEFLCASVKSNTWFQFKDHRWSEIDSGTTLRKYISTELRQLYKNKADSINHTISELPDGSDDKLKKLSSICQRICEIAARLGRTNDKKNIMTEAKELFYDGTFYQKLDTNPYLLGFKNGVIDFKEKKFRRGYPEDYLSKNTNIIYKEINENIDRLIIDEITDFMRKLFPEPELYNYMWEHLASTLIGTSANQTFNMYIGVGQNGKSVLVSLMEKILGEYKGDVPLSLVTDRRTKIGGLAPEMVALKGIRYAVMQEPSKGDRINEGIMKQITSGIDPIQARAPYMTQSLTFIPQFKLVVCSNEFMEIKSQDHGTWRRIRVVDFKSMFVENPVDNDPDKPYQYKLDKHLKEKFDSWKEVFASLLVSIVFKTNGVVEDCAIVMASSNSYRESQDYIAEFIRDRILVSNSSGDNITKLKLNSEFTLWYQSTYGKGGPNPKDVHSYMDKRFGKYDKHKCWKGVKINDDYADNGDDDIPEPSDDISLLDL